MDIVRCIVCTMFCNLWLLMALSLALYGSLWLPLWLSLPLSGILWPSLAHYCSLISRIQSLIGSQRRCHADALSPALACSHFGKAIQILFCICWCLFLILFIKYIPRKQKSDFSQYIWNWSAFDLIVGIRQTDIAQTFHQKLPFFTKCWTFFWH